MMRPVSLPIWTILRGTSRAAGEGVDRVGTPIEDEIRAGGRQVAGGNLFEDAGRVCRQGAGRRAFFHLRRRCGGEGQREDEREKSAQHGKTDDFGPRQ